MPDLAIKSKRMVLPQGVQEAVLNIRDGRITDIFTELPNNYTGELIDVGHRVVMAGVIDPHVHINEPGRTDWEGFDTATRAAIAGGVTTLVDMPLNSSPVTTSVQALQQKRTATKNKLHTNCGFWGGIIPGNAAQIEELAGEGVLGFKAFLTHSGIDEFPNVTEDDLHKAMPLIAKAHLPLLVHCELTDDTNANKAQSLSANRSYQHYLSSRPKEWEDAAIALMIGLCETHNCKVHIVHLSSSTSIEQIAKAKRQGLPVSVETAQHYLYFNAENIEEGQTAYKCAPPIREKENNEKLWQALQEGIIDFVATDHSPAPPALKELQSGDFSKAWGGIASLQFALPALWTAGLSHKCSLQQLSRWLSENPAKLIGKEKSKGKIAMGYDADIIVWEPERQFVITPDIIQHKHKTTPYLGQRLIGVIDICLLGGEVVYENGKFLQSNKGALLVPDNIINV